MDSCWRGLQDAICPKIQSPSGSEGIYSFLSPGNGEELKHLLMTQTSGAVKIWWLVSSVAWTRRRKTLQRLSSSFFSWMLSISDAAAPPPPSSPSRRRTFLLISLSAFLWLHLYNLYIIKWFIFNVYTCPCVVFCLKEQKRLFLWKEVHVKETGSSSRPLVTFHSKRSIWVRFLFQNPEGAV